MRLDKMRELCRLGRSVNWRGVGAVASDTGHGSVNVTANTKMSAWKIEKYGGVASMVYDHNAPMPAIRSGSDVMVEIHAASVNPLDVEMTNGYGRKVIGTMRCMANLRGSNLTEFPLILGRDFSGVIRDKGMNVPGFEIGEEVMGVVLAPRQGSHAHYTVTPSTLLVKKPSNLTHEEAASLCYAGLTAWSALTCFGGLGPTKSKGKRALIFGGSGGVGTVAIQFLKAWGAQVGCVASTSAIDLVSSLGADIVLDYTKPQWQNDLKDLEGFDIVLNCVSHSASGLDAYALKRWSNAKFVTVNTPFLRNIDAFGWPVGLLQSTAEFGYDSVRKLFNGQWHRWAYVLPTNSGLAEIAKLAETGKLVPVIERVYPMDEIQSAYEKVKAGHSRGKTVINIRNSNQQ